MLGLILKFRIFNKQGVAKEKGLAKNNESTMMMD
jgi:hypothetical protein